jgi:malate dehydrogenase (oxaloacetate-decarboxylating)
MPRVSPYFDIVRRADGEETLEVSVRGDALLRLGLTNKGTAFTEKERLALGLDGLLPPRVTTLEEQIDRAYRGLINQSSPLLRYVYLRQLQERSEILFYAVLAEHLEELLPIVYTPTVGEAVQQYHHIYQAPRGVSFSSLNIDRAREVVDNYPLSDVRMIVATDSSAILGLGDQGYGGVAIPIGKLALYTVGGGVSPFHTLPVVLDVGTNRQDLLDEAHYLGVRQRRIDFDQYFAFMDRIVEAIHWRWPRAIIQWEDLSKVAAFSVLRRYRDVVPSFNDDIQGTGAVALAGVLVAAEQAGRPMADQIFLCYGAGAGGAGVAWVLRQGLMDQGLSRDEASRRIFMLDSQGLLFEGRPGRPMEDYKREFAQPASALSGWEFEGDAPDLVETIQQSGATALLGLSGQACAFDRRVVDAMLGNCERPIIFPLSNPTSACEALPVDLFAWSDGRALVATGSPFDDVYHDGAWHHIGQGNNAFVFPGLGFGSILSGAMRITDGMVMAAAYALADYIDVHHAAHGRVYPPVSELRQASTVVAARVIAQALDEGVATTAGLEEVTDLHAYVAERFWQPRFLPTVPANGVAKIVDLE